MKNRLKKIRKSKGLTQKELSLISGISVERISHYENNHGYPSLSTAIGLSEVLGVTVNDVYVLEGKDFWDER